VIRARRACAQPDLVADLRRLPTLRNLLGTTTALRPARPRALADLGGPTLGPASAIALRMRDGRLGNYRVVSCIGEGGMGTVYRVEHALLGREAAVKVLRPELSTDPAMVERFFNEARATAQLRHPGIVDVFDVGYCADGAAFLVMELLRGESLASRLRRTQRLPWQNACEFARQIASALAASHRAQIVHRDLKPDNVFVVAGHDPDDERTKVLDFGIAKLTAAGARGSARTRADVILGTPAYMSPQQCRGAGELDHRADIYALGCILFEMVCGRPPFVGEGVGDLINAHMALEPPSPRGLVPALPDTLDLLILRMLAKPEAARPPSMDAVAAELDAILDAGGGLARVATADARTLCVQSARAAAVTTFGGSAGQVSAVQAPPAARRRLPILFTAAAAAGMIVTVAAAAVYRDDAARAAREPVVTASAPPVDQPLLPAPAVTVGPPAIDAGITDAATVTATADAVAPANDARTPDAAPARVVHEVGCDPSCDVLVDGAVVGHAGPGHPYRVELVARPGQLRSYALWPVARQYRASWYRAPADRSVRTTIHLPCAPRPDLDASEGPAIYDPYAPCGER